MDSKRKDKRIKLKQKIKKEDSLKNQSSFQNLGQSSEKVSEDLKLQKNSSQNQESLKSKETSPDPEPLSKEKILSSLKKKASFSKKNPFLEEFKKKEESLIRRAEKAEKEFLYLRAEFENYKRRAKEDQSRLIRYSGERFISELATEVLDDLDRALFASQDQKSVEDLQKGLQMIDKKLKKLFQKFGVEALDPKGKVFDPSYQEALSYVENPDIPEDQVVETYKKAYKLYDKVIRPAQVLVSKKASKDSF